MGKHVGYLLANTFHFDVSPIFVISHVLNAVAVSIPPPHEEDKACDMPVGCRWARCTEENTTDARGLLRMF